MGDVIVEGERLNDDPFVTSVDDVYQQAIDDGQDSPERDYFIAGTYSTFTAFTDRAQWDDGMITSDPEEILDTVSRTLNYHGPYGSDSFELDNEVEAWIENDIERVISFSGDDELDAVWEMVEEATQVTREFKAQGIIPTGDQVERETARRRRERYQVGAA